jgi:hypothetical protein
MLHAGRNDVITRTQQSANRQIECLCGVFCKNDPERVPDAKKLCKGIPRAEHDPTGLDG